MSRRPTPPRVRTPAGAASSGRSGGPARSGAAARTTGARAPDRPAGTTAGPRTAVRSPRRSPARDAGTDLRAGVPSDAPRRRSRLISVRALVLGVVGLIGFSLVFPTVQAWLGQRAELDALAAEVDEAEQAEHDLQAELDRWDDPAYVQAQARERLSYVMPGETSYRVIDPEVVVETEPDPTSAPGTGPALPSDAGVVPWYATVWESVQVAGAADVAGADGEGASEGGASDGRGTGDDAGRNDGVRP